MVEPVGAQRCLTNVVKHKQGATESIEFQSHSRTLLADLRRRMCTSLVPARPAVAWLVGYVSVRLNKHPAHELITLASYEYLHGKAADEDRLT